MNTVLLFSYAHLRSIDDVEPFYKHVLRKHYSEEALEAGKQQFRSIGTSDTLTAVTHRIGDALSKELTLYTGEKWTYTIGTKHTEPFVDEAVKECLKNNVEKILTVSLSPLSSLTGTAVYQKKVMETLSADSSVSVYHLQPYYNETSFVDVLRVRMEQALQWLPKEIDKEAIEVIFTAHSMPGIERVHQEFIEQYHSLASALMHTIDGIHYKIAYRSGKPAPQKWLGPDVLNVINDCAARGKKAVVLCELLSIVANAEVIQEIGRDSLQRAYENDLAFVQMEYTNDAFDFVKVLRDLCIKRLESAPEIQASEVLR